MTGPYAAAFVLILAAGLIGLLAVLVISIRDIRTQPPRIEDRNDDTYAIYVNRPRRHRP